CPGPLGPAASFLAGGGVPDEPHLPSQGSVVAAERQLLVVNAGSGDLSVFGLDGMERIAIVPTGGSRPVSVTVANGHAFVLNGGAEPSIGEIASDNRSLISVPPLAAGSDPAQVTATPDGRMLVVTERGTNSISLLPLNGGSAVSFPSAGTTPYGFDFAGDTLVVTEAFGGAAGAAAASSYPLAARTLEAVSLSIADTPSAVCRAGASPYRRPGWVTNLRDRTI